MTVLCASGQDLESCGHFASARISALKKGLQETWLTLEQVTLQRSQMLQKSLVMHQYYTRMAEAESWMNDRLPLMSQDEYGKDEDATQVWLVYRQFASRRGECKMFLIN